MQLSGGAVWHVQGCGFKFCTTHTAQAKSDQLSKWVKSHLNERKNYFNLMKIEIKLISNIIANKFSFE
jgi:hypothetical protein